MVKIFHDIVIVLNAQNIEKSVGGFEFSPRAAKPQMGKIKFPMSHERLIFIPMQVKNFPMNGSAGVVKKIPPQAAKPRVVEFFFTTTAEP